MVRRRSAILLLTLVSLLTALAVSSAAASAAKLPATWSQPSAFTVVHANSPVSTTFTLTAKKSVKKVKLSVAGKGKSLVRLSPKALGSLRKGKPKTVTVTVTARTSTALKQYTATITALSGRRAVAKSVKLTVVVSKAPPTFQAGTETPLASTTIGPAGGTITAPAGDSPVNGVQVTIPAGDLTSDQTVSLGSVAGSLTPEVGTFAGAALDLKVGDQHEFDAPISVTAPWPDTSQAPVPYYVDDAGELHLAQLSDVDPAAHTFTFETFHASWFSWIWTAVRNAYGTYDTLYKPERFGMQIVNRGSVYNRGGECFGMTSFSMWYYQHHSFAGNLYPRFMTSLGTNSDGSKIYGQNVIATRAFISISQKWGAYWNKIVSGQYRLSDEVRYISIVSAIRNTHFPVLVDLRNQDGTGGAHSVLAYAYDAPQGTLKIYNPNDPGKTEVASLNASTLTFDKFAGFDRVAYSGDGSLMLAEDYEHIYNDALANFSGSDKATISLTTPAASGSAVDGRTATISGVVHSGSVLVSKLTILVGSTTYAVDVPSTGEFTKEVNLTQGINHLKFQTQGPGSGGGLIDVPNTMDTTDYTIDCTAPNSILLATLTWSTPDTDLDLYVTDPLGETAYYSNRTTSSGGTLDNDVKSGYGPEHFTLLTSDTIQWGQPYTIRVHFYSEHSYLPIVTPFLVTLQVYEGTARQMIVNLPGVLVAANSSNSSPGSTGLDWATVGSVTLTQ